MAYFFLTGFVIAVVIRAEMAIQVRPLRRIEDLAALCSTYLVPEQKVYHLVHLLVESLGRANDFLVVEAEGVV